MRILRIVLIFGFSGKLASPAVGLEVVGWNFIGGWRLEFGGSFRGNGEQFGFPKVPLGQVEMVVLSELVDVLARQSEQNYELICY